jgi:hypothetical protein
MTTFAFDTHSVYKEFLQAGFDEKQTDVILKTIKRIDESTLSREYFDLKIKELDFKFTELRKDLIIQVYTAMGAMTTFLCVVLPYLIKR